MWNFASIFIIHLLNLWFLLLWWWHWDSYWVPVVENLVINILFNFVHKVRAFILFFWFAHGLSASVLIIEFLLLFLIFFLFFNLSFYGLYFHSSVLILVPVDTLAGLHVVVGADHVNNVCMCMG